MTHLHADFCIAGGGLAGCCAALAAARNGASVILLQDRSVLGGNASSEIRMHIVGASCSGKRPGARESGLLEELRLDDAVHNPQRSPSLHDLLLYDKIRREPNITLLLDTTCTAATVANRRIQSISAIRPSTQHAFTIHAPFFLDATGDGHLALSAGASFRMGRESQSQHNESLAPPTADSKTLGSTILLMARRHPHPMPFSPPPWARKFSAEDLHLRSHREFEYGYWWIEWGGELHTIHDNDRIRHELLAITLGVWDHVKNHCSCTSDASAQYDKWLDAPPPSADAANWALDWIGMLPGKRESRRFLGPHILTQHDILDSRIPHDTVAYGGWWIDTHPPAGVDAIHEFPCHQTDVPHLYGIPLRALYSRDLDNLFLAGRNISATHIAFASTRVMGTCATIGQAVGSAAAIATQHQLSSIPDIPLAPLQQLLLSDDAFLLNLTPHDPLNLAPQAHITASSYLPDSPPSLLTNGFTRATNPTLHPTLPLSSNQWQSAQLPASLHLQWPNPIAIRRIHLTFDSGLHRELTLSHSDLFNTRMIRGPQPETVRHYSLATDHQSILEISDNHQRHRRHTFDPPITTQSLHLQIHATHGDPTARLFEIRVYA